MRTLFVIFVCSVAIFAAAERSNARPRTTWEKLGERSVDFGRDRDVIQVGRSEGRFRRLKLIVRNNAVEMISFKVIYGNGEPDELPVRSRIRAGGETRAIDLKGDARAIREVQLVYKSVPNFRGKAVVELWGLQGS